MPGPPPLHGTSLTAWFRYARAGGAAASPGTGLLLAEVAVLHPVDERARFPGAHDGTTSARRGKVVWAILRLPG